MREEKRSQHEKTHQARNIISSHSLDEFKANQPYYFVVNGKTIHKIMVTEDQVSLLEVGQLGIVRIEHGMDDYTLVSKANYQKIGELDPRYLVCHHELDTEVSKN